jgi:hypothetical protein
VSKVRNAPGYKLELRQKRLRVKWYPGSTDGFHKPFTSIADKALARAVANVAE